jgi:uncharacterized protein YciI
MRYGIMSEDVVDSLEKKRRHAHLGRLNNLASQDRLLAAGPHPTIDSSEPGEAGFSAVSSLQNLTAWNKLKLGPMQIPTCSKPLSARRC